MEKEKGTPKRRRWLLGCLAAFGVTSLLVVIGGAVFIFYIASAFEDASQCETMDLTAAGLEGYANIDLPTGISDFSVDCSGFMDNHTLDVQFTLAPADLNALQAGIENLQTWEPDADLTETMISPLNGNINRRQIEGMSSYIFMDGTRFTAIVDTSDPESYQVYWTTFVYF